MCHKERKIGTMVERIQPVSPANFLYNMVKIFAYTSNVLTPSHLQTTFGARHESTGFCPWVSSTRKGPVHIPNWKGAMQKVCIRALYQKWPKKMLSTHPVHHPVHRRSHFVVPALSKRHASTPRNAVKTTTWGALFAYFPGVPPQKGGAVNLKKTARMACTTSDPGG